MSRPSRAARPLLVSATGSDAGIAYAARHSDVVFITSPGASDFASAIEVLPAHAERVKAPRAASAGACARCSIPW